MAYTSTILIVDDEPNAQATLQALLFNEGYTLVFAHTGAEALARAVTLAPDLILLDVMMPGMNGFEVCRRLRADARLAQVPVILITALDDQDSRLAGIKAGADDFISKPFNRIELRARVRTITQLNRYRQLLQERANFAWVIEQADDGYVIVSARDEVLYANAQARLYLNLPDRQVVDTEPARAYESMPASATFSELARPHYQLDPPDLWADWPKPSGATASPSRYLVRPESSSANPFWLQVDSREMSSGSQEQYLVRLRDITASITARNNMWSFHGIIHHKLRTPSNVVTGFLALLIKNLATFSSEKLQEMLSLIQSNALRLQEEILNILQYVDAMDMDTQGMHQCRLNEISWVISEIQARLGIKNGFSRIL